MLTPAQRPRSSSDPIDARPPLITEKEKRHWILHTIPLAVPSLDPAPDLPSSVSVTVPLIDRVVLIRTDIHSRKNQIIVTISIILLIIFYCIKSKI